MPIRRCDYSENELSEVVSQRFKEVILLAEHLGETRNANVPDLFPVEHSIVINVECLKISERREYIEENFNLVLETLGQCHLENFRKSPHVIFSIIKMVAFLPPFRSA